MINYDQAIGIHRLLVERFGGLGGIRDKGALKSALSRPYQTFNQKELYPNIVDKAASLVESIVRNHPFIDGNKRTGYVLMRLLLMIEGKDIKASQDEKFNLIINIANGTYEFEEIKQWISDKMVIIS